MIRVLAALRYLAHRGMRALRWGLAGLSVWSFLAAEILLEENRPHASTVLSAAAITALVAAVLLTLGLWLSRTIAKTVRTLGRAPATLRTGPRRKTQQW